VIPMGEQYRVRKTVYHVLKFLIILFSVLILSSCAINMNSYISEELRPSTLSAAFNSKPINLKRYSRCAISDVTVRIVNAEKRNEDVDISTPGLIGTFVYNPHELTDQIKTYMEDAFRKSGITTKDQSDKIIEIAIKHAEILVGVFNRGADVQLTIGIPERKYIETFSATSWTGGINMYRAMAYAIHETTWKVVNDPIIKDYLLCTKKTEKDELPTGETALEILNRRYVKGEITKDQYEQMKNDIR